MNSEVVPLADILCEQHRDQVLRLECPSTVGMLETLRCCRSCGARAERERQRGTGRLQAACELASLLSPQQARQQCATYEAARAVAAYHYGGRVCEVALEEHPRGRQIRAWTRWDATPLLPEQAATVHLVGLVATDWWLIQHKHHGQRYQIAARWSAIDDVVAARDYVGQDGILSALQRSAVLWARLRADMCCVAERLDHCGHLEEQQFLASVRETALHSRVDRHAVTLQA